MRTSDIRTRLVGTGRNSSDIVRTHRLVDGNPWKRQDQIRRCHTRAHPEPDQVSCHHSRPLTDTGNAPVETQQLPNGGSEPPDPRVIWPLSHGVGSFRPSHTVTCGAPASAARPGRSISAEYSLYYSVTSDVPPLVLPSRGRSRPIATSLGKLECCDNEMMLAYAGFCRQTWNRCLRFAQGDYHSIRRISRDTVVNVTLKAGIILPLHGVLGRLAAERKRYGR